MAAPAAQTPEAPAYKPKFAGDPAHSDAEAGTLGYIRTVLNAQKLYKKRHGSYATTLPGLINTGSFTRRMTKTDRGDYHFGGGVQPGKLADGGGCQLHGTVVRPGYAECAAVAKRGDHGHRVDHRERGSRGA